MTRSTTWALFVGGLLVFALAATAFFSAPSIAGNSEHGSQKGPDAFWSVPRVDATIKPGETKQIRVTLTAADGLDAGTARIVPALAANVQVSPTSIPHLRKGQTQTFTLTFSAPINALPTTTDGVLQLRETEDKRRLGENIARPLPISVRMIWPVATGLPGGIVFSYPTFGRDASVTSYTKDDGAVVVDISFSAPGAPPASQYRFAFVPNPGRLSLTAWFSQNVDLSGSILSTGAFSSFRLSNGFDVLTITGAIPAAHAELNGPVSDYYAESASGQTVVILASGQANQFDLLGIDDAARRKALLGMLETVVVP